MSKQHYHIEEFHDVILVTLRGCWNLNTNIQYLATFGDILNARRGKAFYIIVDMRTWRVPHSESFARIKAPIQIDRRNQKIEIWLEDDDTVADHIAAKFSNEQNFTLHRTKDLDSFIGQVDSVFEAETKAHIHEWLSRHAIDKQN